MGTCEMVLGGAGRAELSYLESKTSSTSSSGSRARGRPSSGTLATGALPVAPRAKQGERGGGADRLGGWGCSRSCCGICPKLLICALSLAISCLSERAERSTLPSYVR